MFRSTAIGIAALAVAGLAVAQDDTAATGEAANEAPEAQARAEAPPTAESGGVKSMLGMSILGNEEAPKSLVIVPWKSSEIGAGIGVDALLDDSPVPVDKDVFMRELRYYQIRSNSTE